MNDKDYAFLKELVETPSPSGYEQPAQRVLRRELAPVADSLETDMLGNLVAGIKGVGEQPLRVMLAGHCDEIGFMVRYIDDQGFLYFAPIGGVDPHLVPGQRVRVHGAAGAVPGVIGKKPIHLTEAKERETVAKFKHLYIDLGCRERKEAEALVAVGDPVTFAAGMERLQGDRVTSRAFDDKMGAFVVAQVLKAMRRRGGCPVELFGVSTVQEEIGLRGAATSAFALRPDVGIVIEVGFATDLPDGERKELGDIRLGKGPIISRGANINPHLHELLVTTAREEEIPLQFMGEPRATGTDANVLQLSRNGVATALVRVPLRYMHTPVEVLDLGDLDQAVALVVGVLNRLPAGREALLPR